MKQYTARSLDDVLKNVAKEKNVEQSDLIYYVIEEKSGFLGIGSSVTAEVFALDDVKLFVEEYFDKFFTGLGLKVEQEITVKNNNVKVSLNADNNAILIGKNGKSLEGMNMLLKHVVNSEFKRRFYVMIDINNYKTDRYQKLKTMAKRIAKNVSRSKIDASLDPMPNDERRVIHKELTNFPGIRTQSEGSGRDRHLKIVYDPNKE